MYQNKDYPYSMALQNEDYPHSLMTQAKAISSFSDVAKRRLSSLSIMSNEGYPESLTYQNEDYPHSLDD